MSSPEERRGREKVLIALMLDDCRSSMAQHPCLLAYVLGDEG
ncbi:hypothetical protein [Bordetella genomosp. 10]|nr:hypothetical protein [Bordetella genomosp. 10]